MIFSPLSFDVVWGCIMTTYAECETPPRNFKRIYGNVEYFSVSSQLKSESQPLN
jgi:hypothetical protein